jgi:hypothetical protein
MNSVNLITSLLLVVTSCGVKNSEVHVTDYFKVTLKRDTITTITLNCGVHFNSLLSLLGSCRLSQIE